MEGEPLKHAFTFTYLGYGFRADGKAEHAIEERMRKEAKNTSRVEFKTGPNPTHELPAL